MTSTTVGPPAATWRVDPNGEIPSSLKAAPRWCCWKLEPNAHGRPTKRPDQRTTDLAACRKWEPVANVPRWSEGGVGFVMHTGQRYRVGNGKSDGWLVILDLDACRDPRTECIAPEAIEMVEALGGTYTEVSPSGTGLRVIVIADDPLPPTRSKMRPTWSAQPNCGGKKPEVQLFTTAGYVTMTGSRLLPTSREPLTLDLLPFAKRFALLTDEHTRNGIALPQGQGDAPSHEEITRRVQRVPDGEALIAGEWQRVLPDKSASEAFHLLAVHALTAADGHGEAAVDWLLQATAWGRGEIHDSAEPEKYGRWKWVAKDVARAAAKARPQAADAFENLGPLPGAPASDAKPTTVFGDPLAVVDECERDGALVHLSTGIVSLDLMTGGGPPLGSRVYLAGAPNAGKTAVALQVADVYLQRGIPVAFLGVDEEPVDLATRLMQRRGVGRSEVEKRSPATLARMRDVLGKLPLRLFDGSVTIEKAASELNRFARSLATTGDDRPPCVLVIDSVQTAKCEGERDDEALYTVVTKRVRAIRTMATKFRMLVIATSEMNRSAYRSKKAEEQSSDMASAKESGAIEFSARVLLSLRSVPGASDVVELRIVKNKHGRDHRNDEDGIFLKVDRDRQQLDEDVEFTPLDADELREAKRVDRAEAREVADAAKLFELISARPLTINATEAALREAGVPRNRGRAARDWLKSCKAIVEEAGESRSTILVPVPANLPPDVRAAMAGGPK